MLAGTATATREFGPSNELAPRWGGHSLMGEALPAQDGPYQIDARNHPKLQWG